MSRCDSIGPPDLASSTFCASFNASWLFRRVYAHVSSRAPGIALGFTLASLKSQVAPVTESVDKEWNRVSLTVAQDGTITSHTGKLAIFGLEKEVGPVSAAGKGGGGTVC